MEKRWHIEMLGWLRATRTGCEIAAFRSRKTGNLLAYLAHHSQRSHPREMLIELLWPGSPPARGRSNLRTELAWLRRRLEPRGVPAGSVLQCDGDTLRLNPTCCRTDVALFETALSSAQQADTREERTRWLTEAVRLYKGELLPGYFEAWMAPERVRLAEAFLQTAHELVVERELAGDLPGALHLGWRAVGVDPLREETHADLIRLLAAAGQPEAALRQHQMRQRLIEHEQNPAAPRDREAAASPLEQALLACLSTRTAELETLRQQLATRTAEAEAARQSLAIESSRARELRREVAERTAEARSLRRQLDRCDPPR